MLQEHLYASNAHYKLVVTVSLLGQGAVLPYLDMQLPMQSSLGVCCFAIAAWQKWGKVGAVVWALQ